MINKTRLKLIQKTFKNKKNKVRMMEQKTNKIYPVIPKKTHLIIKITTFLIGISNIIFQETI